MNKFYWVANTLVFLLAAFVVLAGCTRQKNRMYFAAVDMDDPDPTVKFYRITVKATSNSQATELLTGYFDGNSLRQLYGEIVDTRSSVEPKAQSTTPTAAVYQLKGSNAPLQRIGHNDLFTVFYGTNATAMAQQVQTVGNSTNTGKQFASLLAAATLGEDYLEASRQTHLFESRSSSAKLAIAELKKIKEQLEAARKDLEKSENATLNAADYNEYLKGIGEVALAALGEIGVNIETDNTGRETLQAKRTAHMKELQR